MNNFKPVLKILLLFLVYNANAQVNDAVYLTGDENKIYYRSSIGFLVETHKLDSAIGYSYKMVYNPEVHKRTVWYLQSDVVLAEFGIYDKRMTNAASDVFTTLEIKHGKYQEWFLDGTKRMECNYKNDQLDSIFNQFYPTGQLKRTEVWKEGKWLSGKCYNIDGSETAYCSYQKFAEYKGGLPALFKYLSVNVRYPVEAQSKGIEGRVFVSFVIDKTGQIAKIKLAKGVNKYLDAEALRVVSKMPDWEPGRLEGEVVNMEFTLPVNFRLQ